MSKKVIKKCVTKSVVRPLQTTVAVIKEPPSAHEDIAKAVKRMNSVIANVGAVYSQLSEHLSDSVANLNNLKAALKGISKELWAALLVSMTLYLFGLTWYVLFRIWRSL